MQKIAKKRASNSYTKRQKTYTQHYKICSKPSYNAQTY